MRVAYLGPPGTFSEEALGKLPAAWKVEGLPCATIADACLAAENGSADTALVPAENSIEGSVGVTLDMLVHEVDLCIRREVVLAVRLVFAVRTGETEFGGGKIVSHPQPLAQCRRYLREHYPAAAQEGVESTARAAGMVAEGKAWGAVMTAAAAHNLGLRVLADGIQDYPDNATRFVLLGREEEPPSGDDKTSVVFSLRSDAPGSLCAALVEFARRGINLTKVESRPEKTALGRYLFFVDLEGHRQEVLVAETLAAIKKQSSYWKILGSYPRQRRSVR